MIQEGHINFSFIVLGEFTGDHNIYYEWLYNHMQSGELSLPGQPLNENETKQAQALYQSLGVECVAGKDGLLYFSSEFFMQSYVLALIRYGINKSHAYFRMGLVPPAIPPPDMSRLLYHYMFGLIKHELCFIYLN